LQLSITPTSCALFAATYSAKARTLSSSLGIWIYNFKFKPAVFFGNKKQMFVDHSVKQSAEHSRIIIFFSAHRSLSGLPSGHATEECLSCTKHVVHVVCAPLFSHSSFGPGLKRKGEYCKNLSHKEVSVAASIVVQCANAPIARSLTRCW
jgi:hypothetical protein